MLSAVDSSAEGAAQSLPDVSSTTKPSVLTSLQTEEEEEEHYWDREGWIPLNKNGTQRTPNQIRGELQRYIDKCGSTQSAVLDRMGVNSNSFRRFMDPKSYKNMWSACDNGTYWAAARLLEKERNKPKASVKRKAAAVGSASGEGNSSKKSKKEAKSDAISLMQSIMGVTGVNDEVVHDSCPELVKKIKTFLEMDGVTKSDFCSYALGGIQSLQLDRFLMAKHQDGAGMVAYPRAWAFFEKKRLMDGAPKSKARVKNEAEHPLGFRLSKPPTHVWVFTGGR